MFETKNIIKKVYNEIKKFKVADIGQVRPKFKTKAVKGMTFVGFYRIPLLMLLTKISGHKLSNIRAVDNQHKQDLVSLIESGLWREGNYISPTVIITKSGKLVLLTGEHTFQAFYDSKNGDLFVAVVEFDTFQNAKTWQSNENANLEYVKRGRGDEQVAQSTKDIVQYNIDKGLIDKSNIDEMESNITDILKDQDITKANNGEAKIRRLINQVLQYYNDDIEVVKNYTDEEKKEYINKHFAEKKVCNGKIHLNDDNTLLLDEDITNNENGLGLLRSQKKLLELGNWFDKTNYPKDKISIEYIKHISTANSKEYDSLKKDDTNNVRMEKWFKSLENIIKIKPLILNAKKHYLPQLPKKGSN